MSVQADEPHDLKPQGTADVPCAYCHPNNSNLGEGSSLGIRQKTIIGVDTNLEVDRAELNYALREVHLGGQVNEGNEPVVSKCFPSISSILI